MNISEFNERYAGLKDIDKVFVDDLCSHPQHVKEGKDIKKVAAKRNIFKHGGEEFICRTCDLHYNNPALKKGQGRRQSDELITVHCPHPEHVGETGREMKKNCYFGKLEEPYIQICGSCAQKGKVISEEQKEKISIALTGIKRSDEFKTKLSEYMKNNEEGIARATKNLIAGYSAGWNIGMQTPEEVKHKISKSNKGKVRTPKHKLNVSEGRKKMLQKQGGFTKEHRENLSKATVRQYQNGFEPKLFHLTGYHKSNKVPDGKIYYASSYEKKAFMLLDDDEKVLSYVKEKVSIPYFNPVKEIESNYLVDLEVTYTDGSIKLIEVKPRKWINQESTRDDVRTVVAKIKAGEEFGKVNEIPFEVWDEIVLFGENPEKKINLFVKNMKIKDVITQGKKEVEYFFGDAVVDVGFSIYNVDQEVAVWVVSKNSKNEMLSLDMILMIKNKGKWSSSIIHEQEGPIAVCCPINLLEMTPKEKCSSYNEVWRQEVINNSKFFKMVNF